MQVPQHPHSPPTVMNQQRGICGKFCTLGTLKDLQLPEPEYRCQ